jgi:L-threonylcarbamoyladenylate synthase
MLIQSDDPGLDSAATALKSGELIAFPTDTFFALGVDGLNPNAVESVFEVKGRNPGTPVPLLISDSAMVDELATEFPDTLRELTLAFWPGALTIVLPSVERVPDVVTAGTGTVGLRIPDHDIARKLIELAGFPLTGTSCNITGRPPIKEASVVEQVFNDDISGCINSECGESTEPSTVVEYRDGKVLVLRAGAISIESLRNTVGDIIVNQ